MNISILPLAITMMAGPQIMLSILLVTVNNPIKLSLAYVSSILLATSIGVLLTSYLFSLFGTRIDFKTGDGQLGKIIQLSFIILLVYMAIKSYRERGQQKTPKWLQSVNEMTPGKAFKTGLLLIFLMPTDIIVMLTVGLNLETSNSSFWAALPFILLTVLIAALPLLAYLLFRNKAEKTMPRVRDWMQANSWLVNIIVYALFIFIIL